MKELCSKSMFMDPLAEFKLLDTKLRLLKPAARHEFCNDIICDSKRIVDNYKLLVREIHGKLRLILGSLSKYIRMF